MKNSKKDTTDESNPFTTWIQRRDALRRALSEPGMGHYRVVPDCLALARATWPLARMARTAGCSFAGMLALRARLNDAQYEDFDSWSIQKFAATLVPALRRATVEVEHLFLVGTHQSAALTGKRRAFVDAMKDLGKPATIEEIVMKSGGKTRKVNSDDRQVMRELNGSLVDGFFVRSTDGKGRKLYHLEPFDADSTS